MKILVIGASGLVGSVFVKEYWKKSNLVCPAIDKLDITNFNDVHDYVRDKHISHVLLLAAYTDVEAIQKNPTFGFKINVDGTRNIAIACQKYDKRLIYISSDFVFSGSESNKGPHKDIDNVEPEDSKLIGEYARTKLIGENIVKNLGRKFTIIRISYPFGNPNNERDFAIKTLKLVQNGYALFSDQKFTPTYIPDLTKAIKKIAKEDLNGIFHIVCKQVTTPFEFAKYLVKKMELNFDVKPGNLKDFMTGKTPKPLFGGLVPSRNFDVKNWKDAVDEFVLKLK